MSTKKKKRVLSKRTYLSLSGAKRAATTLAKWGLETTTRKFTYAGRTVYEVIAKG